MPRPLRVQEAGYVQHIVCRANDTVVLFNDEQDYMQYVKYLSEARQHFPIYIYNFVLMHDHIHLLIEPKNDGNLARAMEMVQKNYAKYYNKKYDRSGHVFQGRYKSFVVQEDKYFMFCSRYIDFDAVNAGAVSAPEEYPWSGYRVLAGGKAGLINLDEHAIYRDLGATSKERQIVYKALVNNLQAEDMNLLERRAGVLGDREFKRKFKR